MPTEPVDVDVEHAFRCPAPGCGWRTYCTGDADDDDKLPLYDEDGTLYHGNGEIDIEATGEWAAHNGPGEDDEDPADTQLLAQTRRTAPSRPRPGPHSLLSGVRACAIPYPPPCSRMPSDVRPGHGSCGANGHPVQDSRALA